MSIQQEREFDIFCENCNNILDISRTIYTTNNETLNTETPNTVTDTDDDVNNEVHIDDDNTNYEFLLKKLEDGKTLTPEELLSINIKNMVSNEYYRKMSKKGYYKKKIIELIEDLGNSDDNTQAYMYCKNCAYNRPIPSRFRVISKNPEGVASVHDYINEANYRLKVHMKTIPRTRNFKCPNSSCDSNAGKLPTEAAFFSRNNTSYEKIYVCVNCLTIKIN